MTQDLLRRPGSRLATYVESVWIAPAAAYAGAARVLPVGRASLAMTLDGSPLQMGIGGAPAVGIESPMLDPADVLARDIGLLPGCDGPTVGVHFRPAGLQAFLAQPVATLGRRPLPLRQVWGPEVLAWTSRLRAAAEDGAEAALDELEALLIQRLRLPPGTVLPMQTAASLLAGGGANGEPLPIAQVAQASGLTPRAFRRAFQDATGLKPKEYARLSRFRGSLELLPRSGTPATEVAMDCNYFDQAHFGHEFKALAGMTPTAYRAEADARGPCLFTRAKALLRRLTFQGRPQRAPDLVD